MKLDKLYIGLLFTSASFMVGCSEYEDTETTSPQADANAIGANFAKETQTIKVAPDTKTFDITMNRVNPTGEKVINVKNVRIDNNFCNPATQFKFEDGKMSAKNVVNYDISKCTFQKPDTLTIKIDADAKDHIYGDGYLQTSVAFVVDYTWKDSIKTTAVDEYISSDKAPFPVTVQIATDYDKKKNKTTTLVRLPDYFKNAGKTTKDGAANIQFAVNNSDRKNPQLIWNISNNDFGGLKFNKDKIETGISHIVEGTGDEEDKTYDVYMKGLSISENTSSDASTTAETEEETIDVTYKLEYELYYKDDEGVEHYIDEATPKYSSEFTIKFPKTSDSITSTEE
ncbi:hypothetical protein H6A66_10555 [Bacteroides caecigallinarum]|uniref:hypothetical protein n=1 Tax=Bacteroides caecigallinarum TaxID=1411144 RepID=UPI001956F991|nr:hypothetical protein [Bacteroides caecigallinarum]MBM6865604.1 hypothetical protein [Bacteroides caecigallinarum]